jgi:hypothetical protein
VASIYVANSRGGEFLMFDINSFSEYKVKRETLEAIAEKLRAMIGKTSKLTTEEIIYWLGRVKFIP